MVLIILVIIPVCAMANDFVIVRGDTKSDLNDANDKKNDIQEQIQNTQKEIDELQKKASNTQSYITQLDGKIQEIDTSLVALNTQIESKQAEIDQAQVNLAKSEEEKDSQYEAMKLRIKFMYEHNNENYVEILVSSANMGDMLNKAEYITKISEYDRQMLEKYEQTIKYIADTKKQLEDDYAQMETMKKSLQTQMSSLNLVQETKQKELKQLTAQKDAAESKSASLYTDLAAQEQEIAAMEARIKKEEEERRRQEELKKQQQANSSGGSSSSGGQYTGGAFLWPTVSKRITSDWGDTADRNGPHQGIDIGATSPGVSGDPIYAAADGEVVISTYSASAGYWIWIYHGDGLYTVYMHCSSLGVSVGDKVTRGQTIARMGTSGNSTGVHLHFGVRKNGVYVNPWGYLK